MLGHEKVVALFAEDGNPIKKFERSELVALSKFVRTRVRITSAPSSIEFESNIKWTTFSSSHRTRKNHLKRTLFDQGWFYVFGSNSKKLSTLCSIRTQSSSVR